MAAVALMIAAPASASPIYYDSFTRVGALDGSTPDVGAATWTALSGIETDGQILSFQAERTTMFLPFTPGSGVYELSVDVMLDGDYRDRTEWAALGSTGPEPLVGDSFATGASAQGDTRGYAWMLIRNNGGVLSFAGPGTTANQGGPAAGTYAADVWHTLKVVLDTTGAQWTFDTYVNDVPVMSTYTFAANPDIGMVGLSAAQASAWTHSFDNFTLIPEPATMMLLGMGGLGLLVRRRRTN